MTQSREHIVRTLDTETQTIVSPGNNFSGLVARSSLSHPRLLIGPDLCTGHPHPPALHMIDDSIQVSPSQVSGSRSATNRLIRPIMSLLGLAIM